MTRAYVLQVGKDNLYHVISCQIRGKIDDKTFKIKTTNGRYYSLPSKYIYPTQSMARDAAYNYNKELKGYY